MQRFLQFTLRPSHNTIHAPQGLQKAVTRALELRHPEVLRHLSTQRNAEFAAVLAVLPARQRADALSLLEPSQRESLLRQLPRQAQKQWRSLSRPHPQPSSGLRGLHQAF